MTHIITIETQSESTFTQIKGFAEQLGVRVKEAHMETNLGEAGLKPQEHVDQKEMFQKAEQLRMKLRHIKVDPNLNLSDLANEMLNTLL